MKTICVLFLIVLVIAVCVAREPRCNLSIDPGTCNEKFLRYAFNSLSQSCVQFIYGGCPGNGNRFDTLRECEEACLL